MILSRRKAHFWIWLALVCALPTIFIAGLFGRPTIPTVGEETNDLFAAADFSTEEISPSASKILTVDTINVAVKVSQGDRTLELKPESPFPYSNVLVYWTPTASTDGEEAKGIDDGAVLLGQLSGTNQRRFSLPQDMSVPGFLTFYSLGQNKAIATVPLPQ